MEEEKFVTRQGKPIDWEKVDFLIQAQNTQDEVAGYFNLDRNNFSDRLFKRYGMRFTEYASTFYSKGRSNIKAKQFQLALSGNVRMLERLGDVYCDQKVSKDEKAPNHDHLEAIHKELAEANVNQPQANPILPASDETT